MVVEKAPWRMVDLIDLVEHLKELESYDSNYDVLMQKMRSPKKARTEDIPFIEISRTYLAVGYKVRFWRDLQERSNPDIEIYSTPDGDSFYIEVTKLEESEQRKNMRANFNILSDTFNMLPPQLPFSCQQFKYITKVEMPCVLEKIAAIRQKALSDKDIVYYEDEKLHIAVCHPDKLEELEQWCDKHNYRKGTHSHFGNFDETERIIRYKIAKEAEQIPSNATGLIYIPVDPIYFWVLNPSNTIPLIQNVLNEHSNIFGLVLYATISHEVQPFTISGKSDYYSIKQMNEAIVRHLLFIRNHSYQGNLSDNDIKKIYQSFGNRMPMLYHIYRGTVLDYKGTQEDIVYMVSIVEKIHSMGLPFLFTDRHAYLEQKNVFNDYAALVKLRWDIINDDTWHKEYSDTKKEFKQAEFLIYQHLPVDGILGIIAQNDEIATFVRNEAAKANLSIQVITKPDYYYP